MQTRNFGSSRRTYFARATSFFRCAGFLGALVLFSSLAIAQEGKRPDNTTPPSSKPSAKPEECAPAENASKKTATSSTSTTSETSEATSSASEEAVSQDASTFELRSSLDDTRDVQALDCSKEPDASSAACQRKQSKAAANQCERTEGDSQLTLRKQ